MIQYLSPVYSSTLLDTLSVSRNDLNTKNKEIIYFLFKDGKVVYVGQSVFALRRIKQDHWNEKDFDSFFLIDDLGGGDLDITERFWIKQFKPILNIKQYEKQQ